MSLKNVVIFGDSYSTFEGYIPDGYAVYYSEKDTPNTDVRHVSEMWWYQLIDETNSNLLLNDSYSGSTIGYTGYNNADCSETSSFIFRLKKMIDGNFFSKNKVDTVFVFGGTNDCWSGAPLGNAKYDDFTKEDLYFVLPAVSYFFKKLRETLPEARIICLINTELNPEVSEWMKTVCKRYDALPIQFEHIDKMSGHPTVRGMNEIKDKITDSLKI